MCPLRLLRLMAENRPFAELGLMALEFDVSFWPPLSGWIIEQGGMALHGSQKLRTGVPMVFSWHFVKNYLFLPSR